MEAAAHTLPYDGTIVGGFSLATDRVASVTVPTLVIDGAATDAWRRNAALAVADALPMPAAAPSRIRHITWPRARSRRR